MGCHILSGFQIQDAKWGSVTPCSFIRLFLDVSDRPNRDLEW